MKPGRAVGVFLAALVLSAAAPAQTGWRTYRNASYGFNIRYPASMTYYSGHPDLAETHTTMSPLCDDSTVACFIYNGSEGDGTNFQGAGLSVNVLRDMRTETDCGKIDTGQYPVKSEIIGGLAFRYGETDDLGGGSDAGGPTYRVFRQGVCFEITLRTAWTTMWLPENGPQFSGVKTKRIEDAMSAMLQTFRFAGPVQDGSTWKVYRDGNCGGLFEYPDVDTVRVDLAYSNARYSSDEIPCSESFVHGARKYTVSTKVNLKNEEEVDRWLRASGYPSLHSAEKLEQSKRCTVYRAGPYRYIRFEGNLSLLFVSDPKGPVASDGDRIFAHLADSFKVW